MLSFGRLVEVEGTERLASLPEPAIFALNHSNTVEAVLAPATLMHLRGGRPVHFLTDVFENDPHSPLRFHTQVLGFERIGTHRYGELACASSRILLILDIARAYRRLKERDNKVWKELGEGMRDIMENRLPALPA